MRLKGKVNEHNTTDADIDNDDQKDVNYEPSESDED